VCSAFLPCGLWLSLAISLLDVFTIRDAGYAFIGMRFAFASSADRAAQRNFARWAMEIIEREASVSADGRAVIFQLSTRGRDLECAVTLEALEQHFWLQRGAGEERVLKTFADGRKRIVAVAERKMLARPGEKVLLTISDFVARG
jgi:hypothetical protein